MFTIRREKAPKQSMMKNKTSVGVEKKNGEISAINF
jgi:hypothetical protein